MLREGMWKKCYRAEVMKNRHSAAGKLAVGMPLAGVLLAAALTMDYVVIDSYNWWYTGLLPSYAALVCGAAAGREKRQGNRNILSLPVDLKKIWDGKVLYGVRMLGIAMAVLCMAALLINVVEKEFFHMEFAVDITAKSQLAAAVALFLASLWQVPFLLMLQQFFGSAAALLVHVAGYELLAVTVSLKPYFMFFPGAVPARLMCMVLGILPNGLLAQPGSMTYTPELVKKGMLLPGLAGALIWFFLLWGIGRRLFERRVAG